MEKIAKTGSNLVILLIRVYRYLISPFLGNCCRFSPSCSHYSINAIQTFGVIKGTYLTCKRILRCQPFAKGGWDPLPEVKK